jgi:ATP-dependent DNA helicase RecG
VTTLAASGRTGQAGRRLRQLADLPVERLRGVGGVAGRELAELGIASVLDLLTHYPRRYVDGTRMVPIASLAEGEKASVLARVTRVSRPPVRRGRGRRPPSRVEVDVADEDGRLRVVFFNQSWRANQLARGTLVLLFGPVSAYRGVLQLVNPNVEVLRGSAEDEADDEPARAGRIFPVYPLTERAELTSARISRYVQEALDRAGRFADPVPAADLARLGLLDRTTALEHIHRPTAMDQTEPARQRLAFDELFRLQLAMVLRRRRLEADARGIRHVVSRQDGSPTAVERFVADLPFTLTQGQERAIATITDDLAAPLPMHRLLQGDVGSGKTVVALAAMLVGVEGGHQGALMAPTEVLAEQHAGEVRSLLGHLEVDDPSVLGGRRPLACALLTSKTPAGERSSILEGLAAGRVDLLVGTHALLTEEVTFASLGVVVIDEQHRFGVEQRAALRAKGRGTDSEGRDPDLLVMTATPIPRTAAMVVFGDLDMTVVDELPPGRLPVSTSWLRGPLEEEQAWARIREECARGHRAFVVCPLVEGSAKVEAASVVAEAGRLAAGELAGLDIGILHGQMRPAEKERAMADFRAGRLAVLVATTVIEVGVDVPEATVMVVEDADRFGIAQLHQLRGRVGRGSDPAWCYLLSASDAPDAAARLSAVERTVDGFELAETDLELRGEGTILGERQKGRSDLRLARLGSDRQLVVDARSLADAVVGDDSALSEHPLLAEELRLFVDDAEAEFLFKS